MRHGKISAHLVLQWSDGPEKSIVMLGAVHCVWPNSGSLLSYSLKGVLAAMVAGSARLFPLCHGGK